MKKTALYDIHVKLNAKMVHFAGFEMPIQYRSIRAEHRRVRETVGVFDVSHMGEIEIWGDNAIDMVQKVTINDASTLAVGQIQYSAMCYPDGGIVDDLLVYRFPDHFLLFRARWPQKDIAARTGRRQCRALYPAWPGNGSAATIFLRAAFPPEDGGSSSPHSSCTARRPDGHPA